MNRMAKQFFGAKSPEGKAWRTHFAAHFACCVGTLPTPDHSRKIGVEKVSTRHVENVRHVNFPDRWKLKKSRGTNPRLFLCWLTERILEDELGCYLNHAVVATR